MGLSNSPSALTKATAFGCDTVALAFTGLGGLTVESRMQGALSTPAGRGRLLLEEHPSGARVVYFPQFGTVKVEGRLSALAARDRGVSRLGTRAELRGLPDFAAGVVEDLADVPFSELRGERHHLSRLDVTGEIRFEDRQAGLQMLQAASGLVPGAYKGETIHRHGQVETAYTITRKGRKVARFYDSGLKHGTAAPGELIRYEVQNRWPKASERTPAEMAHSSFTLPQLFARHLEPFTSRAKEITVTTALNAPQQIMGKLAAGELTQRQANGLAGFVAGLPYGGRQLYSDQSARRYLRELRKHGIVLTGIELEQALTIGQALDELLRGAQDMSEAQG
jgi:hypothetical protein